MTSPATTEAATTAAAGLHEPINFDHLRADNTTTLTLGSRVLRLPHHHTQTWLAALTGGQLHRIIPGMLDLEDQTWYLRQLADPCTGFDIDNHRRLCWAVIGHVTGYPWWTAIRLAHGAANSWHIAEPLALTKGVDLLTLPIRRTLSVIYLLAVQSCTKDEDRLMLDNDLYRPPDGVAGLTWTPQQQAASFSAFRAALHSRGR